jgi:diamine N-acetyltransferase
VLWARDGDGTPVAYCLLVHDSQQTSSEPASLRHGPTVELNTFSVHADHHGRGISARLKAASRQAGRLSGAAGIRLGVNRENTRARRFYAKGGYARSGVRTFRMGRRTDHDVILERAL